MYERFLPTVVKNKLLYRSRGGRASDRCGRATRDLRHGQILSWWHASPAGTRPSRVRQSAWKTVLKASQLDNMAMQAILLLLYALAFLAELLGLGCVARDLKKRYKRLPPFKAQLIHAKSIDASVTAYDAHVSTSETPSAKTDIERRATSLEEQVRHFSERQNDLCREIKTDAADRAQYAVDTAMSEIARIRDFLGAADSLRQPTIGLVLLLLGLLFGAAANTAWVATSKF